MVERLRIGPEGVTIRDADGNVVMEEKGGTPVWYGPAVSSTAINAVLWTEHCRIVEGLNRSLAEFKDQLRECKADAARYRFLLKDCDKLKDGTNYYPVYFTAPVSKEKIDALIDEEMAK